MSTTRAISIACGNTSIAIHVPAKIFDKVHNLVEPLNFDIERNIANIELHALVLEKCAKHDTDAALAVLDAFCIEYRIPSTNIHVVVQQHGLNEDSARSVLRAYYLHWNNSAASHCYRDSDLPALSALLASDSTQLMALFGGQPESANYLEEARWLFDVYGPLLSEYVCRMSAFLESNSQDYRLRPVYFNGINALDWFTQNGSVPDDCYLVSVPVCIPLTGLTKLMQIMVLYKTLDISPGELVRLFK
ncbi:beta subunit of fatty acid synthetase, partial [Coemansia sp. RSA 1365]